MTKNKQFRTGRCVDEKLYSSNKYEDIRIFYECLNNVEEWINFSKNRPKADVKIYELNIEFDKNVIVVVPTKDISKTKGRIQSNFSSYFVIVVESSGQYFNFARSMNLGISKALNYNPYWVVLANDDLDWIGDHDLRNIIKDEKSADILLPTVIEENKIKPKFLDLYEQSTIFESLIRILSLFGFFRIFPLTRAQSRYSRTNLFKDKSSIHYVQIPSNYTDRNFLYKFIMRFEKFLFTRKLITIPQIQPISIIKADILKGEKFDEVFINNGEDTDLAIRLTLHNYVISDFETTFTTMGSESLGKDVISSYRRNVQESAYVGYKLHNIYN